MLSGTASFTTTATSASSVGNYAIAGGGLAGGSANYTVSFAQASGNANALSIIQRQIVITAQDQTRYIATQNPPLTYTVAGVGGAAGLVNGDTLTGSLATPANIELPPGVYAIRQGSLGASSNYAVTFIPGTLNVLTGMDVITHTVVIIDTRCRLIRR